MTNVKLSEELNSKIVEYLKKHTPIKIDWDYRDELSKEQIETIIGKDDGIFEIEQDIWEMNLDYAAELEDQLIDNMIDWFKDELMDELDCEEDEIKDSFDFRDEYLDYLGFDANLNDLIRRTRDIPCLIYLYSNYDCTNSFDTMESSEYLQQVYKRVRNGVRKKDFMWEHINGAYGGSMFCFAFKCSILELLELKKQMKTGKRILIPKGTQFGFFSSFQGAGSVFDKETYRNFYLNIKEEGKDFNPEYDHAYLLADIEQSYNMIDVYGSDEFIASQDILIK